ncbi:ABC transporter ATP-binding protein [Pokkaliibacter plantistimulans]|uniref:ABC transporter ATP-binding protein n=2 Tax=Pseudomonadota TaxID=1224 RepID=A0ABX5M0N6_9GAMM|nr:ABC transporter ATP-binding protein [Pokkaliibacter plantistimulans]PPC75178.1 ABC transporter ATP-binding protein [Pokkaliibacter plantistimulans]PXF31248.1 ABC transporter ATP-binding protein [Pokkaliibacter plantistimulans]
MLQVKAIETYYGSSQALFGVDLQVEEGQVVTMLGRNGMGKTTTVSSIMGMRSPKRGEVTLDGRKVSHLESYKVARLGIGLVPEGRRVFPNLNVRENLLAAASQRQGNASPWTLQRVYELFPRLQERQLNMGNQLSGGEQQMLAIGRALMINPRLLILDEATEGLAPIIRDEIWACLTYLKSQGQSILVIDKNLDALLRIADHHFVLEKGRVVWQGNSAQLQQDPQVQHRYLGI